MLNFTRTLKGFLVLAFMVTLAASCSAPKYYVFKTVKHYPHVKEDVAQKKAETPESQTQVTQVLPEEKEEEVALASTEKAAAPVSLSVAAKKVEASKEAVAPRKVSRLEEIKTAIKVKREIKKALKEQKAMAQDPEPEGDGKSQLIALLLAILIGSFGIHRFYLGYTWQGILQLLLTVLGIILIFPLIGVFIWVLIDIIRIATGKLEPKNGEYGETL